MLTPSASPTSLSPNILNASMLRSLGNPNKGALATTPAIFKCGFRSAKEVTRSPPRLCPKINRGMPSSAYRMHYSMSDIMSFSKDNDV